MTHPEATMAPALSALSAQYLTFSLGGETFGMGIRGIKEIIEHREQAEVPMMPPSVRGVINLRGAVVPVVDLSARFARGATVVGQRTCVVIVEIEGEAETQVLGIMVDAVNEVIDVDASQVEPRPTFGAGIRTDFIDSILNIGQRFTVVLDVGRVLSADEIAGLAERRIYSQGAVGRDRHVHEHVEGARNRIRLDAVRRERFGQVAETSAMHRPVRIEVAKGRFAARREQEVVAAEAVLHDRKHRVRTVGPQPVPGGEPHGLLVIERAAVGECLAHVGGGKGDQVGNLAAFRVDDIENLPFREAEGGAAARRNGHAAQGRFAGQT